MVMGWFVWLLKKKKKKREIKKYLPLNDSTIYATLFVFVLNVLMAWEQSSPFSHCEIDLYFYYVLIVITQPSQLTTQASLGVIVKPFYICVHLIASLVVRIGSDFYNTYTRLPTPISLNKWLQPNWGQWF